MLGQGVIGGPSARGTALSLSGRGSAPIALSLEARGGCGAFSLPFEHVNDWRTGAEPPPTLRGLSPGELPLQEPSAPPRSPVPPAFLSARGCLLAAMRPCEEGSGDSKGRRGRMPPSPFWFLPPPPAHRKSDVGESIRRGRGTGVGATRTAYKRQPHAASCHQYGARNDSQALWGEGGVRGRGPCHWPRTGRLSSWWSWP